MDEGMKKLLIIGGSIMGGLLLIILIAAIIGGTGSKNLTYEEFEKRLYNAAVRYYQDNKKELPSYDGEITLSYSTLVNKGYIKPIEKLLKNGSSCTAEVRVTKYADNYSYVPYINCGSDYTTKELYNVIFEDNPTVTEGKGLYEGNNYYYFRGEVTNNYVGLNDKLYRIVKINDDNTITVIKQERTPNTYTWDNRYNIEEKGNYGINDFELSRIKDTLKTLATTDEIFTDTTKAKLTPKQLCIGKRKLDTSDKTNKIECSKLTEDSYYLGLLTVSDYLEASLDPNCTNISSKSCMNYNFLATIGSSFTLTAVEDNTNEIYYYSTRGVKTRDAFEKQSLNVITFISNKAIYDKGNGTESNPYIIK